MTWDEDIYWELPKHEWSLLAACFPSGSLSRHILGQPQCQHLRVFPGVLVRRPQRREAPDSLLPSRRNGHQSFASWVGEEPGDVKIQRVYVFLMPLFLSPVLGIPTPETRVPGGEEQVGKGSGVGLFLKQTFSQSSNFYSNPHLYFQRHR